MYNCLKTCIFTGISQLAPWSKLGVEKTLKSSNQQRRRDSLLWAPQWFVGSPWPREGDEFCWCLGGERWAESPLFCWQQLWLCIPLIVWCRKNIYDFFPLAVSVLNQGRRESCVLLASQLTFLWNALWNASVAWINFNSFRIFSLKQCVWENRLWARHCKVYTCLGGLK